MIAVLIFGAGGAGLVVCRAMLMSRKANRVQDATDRLTHALANCGEYGNELCRGCRTFGGDELALTGAWAPIRLGG